jgi:hypothetical protein
LDLLGGSERADVGVTDVVDMYLAFGAVKGEEAAEGNGGDMLL